MFPTLEDLTGSALALSRLQDTYHLDVTILANGRLTGVTQSTMTINDCFILGRVLFEEKYYEHALHWLIEALRKYKIHNESYNYSEKENRKYIIQALYSLGDVKTILEITKKIVALDADYLEPIDEIISFQKNVDVHNHIFNKNENREKTEYKEIFANYLKKEKIVYEALCRGDIKRSDQISKRLKCSYLSDNHPFLKLGPIKMEQVYIAPDVIMFHQVISDDEIEHIKELAKTEFERSVIVTEPKNHTGMPANDRISKTSWIYDHQSPVVKRITQRVADFTGLNIISAEPLQVANYGIGGHFTPHFDFFVKSQRPSKESKMRKLGNRIATVLFYMSEVAQGGATVFTELGLSVFPVKNAAVFWMNLHPSGEGDIATRHAACPVLRGSKWVSNKWIHQVGQEYIRPCTTEYQKEEVKRKFPKPQFKTSNKKLEQLLHDWFSNGGIQNLFNNNI
ncbi:prolyl 4-hydroxylase subunit alpha-1-like [Battus philenor]|uniref:prolyl 4-hydroxylase subunit alpha-1-like n=1 Tax=Battus philenor TaxID=42288 RepID=UPI0035D00791